ncbi:serine/threonine-protein kinase [Nonomuraea longicatena]|uniref:non-specific serine/threonine protein kinase n=1 Tax=Nonomuraea longicatena TaxID=83682 RepID=A0ABP4A825_9ACTN
MPDDPLLAGRYRLVARLGEGGAGTVWRAVDQTLMRDVAIKQVRVPDGLDPAGRADFAERAMHEARAAGRLRDPAIVLVHDVVLDRGVPWIVMDLSTGRSLDKVVREHGPLPPDLVARIGLRVLSALEVAHAHAILHRDVKPANILLDADGTAFLTDFGIAAPMRAAPMRAAPMGAAPMGAGPTGSDSDDRLAGAGSPGYMAPERLNGLPAGPASDLWSLGASLYTIVQGRPPYERPSTAAVVAAVLLHEPPFPDRAGRELGTLLMALLAKDPAARPGAERIRAVLGAAADPTGRPRRRRLLPPAVALAAVLALGGGIWYGTGLLTRPPDGRYAAAPDPCTLVPPDRVRQIVGAAAPPERTRQGECRWQHRTGSRVPRSLLVRTWTEAPRGSLDGAGVARTLVADERTGRSGAAGTSFRTTTSGVRDVTGIGESAFAYDVLAKYINADTGKGTSLVMFHDSNLVGEVELRVEDVRRVGAADRKAVEEAARTVSASLRR